MEEDQGQWQVSPDWSELSHFASAGSSGCADWGIKYAALPETPVRSL